MPAEHSLGELLNEAVRIKPSPTLSEPKSAHVTFAEMFWETLSARDRQQEIVAELNRLMNYLLTNAKRDQRTERAVWFMSLAFGRLLDSPDETRRHSANAFINTLCDRSQCENKTVRFRSCQSVRMALESLPNNPEIDAAISETVYATLLARVRDRSYVVRTQAVLGLDRFKVAGDDGQFGRDQVTAVYLVALRTDPHPNPRAAILSCLPITTATTESICERTGDESDVVRLHALKVIAAKLRPSALGSRQMGDVLRHGLSDRSDLVQCSAVETLLVWFDDVFHQNPQDLLRSLDCETHGDLFPRILDVLLTERMEEVLNWGDQFQTDWSCLANDITLPETFFLKSILCATRLKADAFGKEATTDVEKAEASQRLFDLIDRLLPPSLEDFVTVLRELYELECLEQCRLLLQILNTCFNFADDADRAVTSELYRDLCRLPPTETGQEGWYPTVMAFGRKIFPDTGSFVRMTLGHLEETAVLSDVSREGKRREQFHHWLCLSVEMLRTLPFKTRNFFALGTSTCSLTDVLNVYKTSAADPDSGVEAQARCLEGAALCLAFKATHEDAEFCLSLLWNALEHREKRMKTAAIDALCTLAQIKGTRYIDGIPPNDVVVDAAAASTDVWNCTAFAASSRERRSFGLTLTALLYWDDEIEAEVKSAALNALCRLLTINRGRRQSGMSCGECVQCLCPLTALFVYGDEKQEWSAYANQMLQIFFDRFARAHSLHQYMLRVGFIPILRYCLEMTQTYRLSIGLTVRFLGSLLLAPLHVQAMTEEEIDAAKRDNLRHNTQLVCLLLMEIARTPGGSNTSKAYTSALWRVIVEMDIHGSDVSDRARIKTILGETSVRRALTEKQFDDLGRTLGAREEDVAESASDGSEEVKEKIGRYMDQLGSHPLSDREDDE